ncbi:MAG: rhomboid family intramembrane serine protease [bacterium]|nr:rhomboid family intramembrane serine protease [bacterium]
MFFTFPIRTEKETVKLPYLTMGLIILNLTVWIYTDKIVRRETRELAELNGRLTSIEMPYLRQIHEQDPEYFQTARFEQVHERFYAEVAKDSWKPEHEEWRSLYADYRNLMENRLFMRWGFIPGRFSLVNLIISLFLHAGFMHLFGNMLFLWAVGCNLEDDWGWWGFGICYLLSGISAWGLHMLRAPDSLVPGVGASGAIAGIMGVFLVKYYGVKMKFLYIFLPRFWKPVGFFTARAYVVLPVWFLLQLIGARSAGESGTAYWAHIGGFVFGAFVAGSLKMIGLGEGLFDAPASLAAAAAGMPRIDPAVPLVKQARAALEGDPRNARKYFFYGRAFATRGMEKNAALLYNMGLDILFRSPGSANGASPAAVFRELSGLGYLDRLSEKNLYRLAAALEKGGIGQEAVSLYMMYANQYPSGRAREKSLTQSYFLLRDRVGDAGKAAQMLEYLKREYPDSGFALQAQPEPGEARPAALPSKSAVAQSAAPVETEGAFFVAE